MSIEEDINELKILLFQDRLTNYGKREMINYYENEIARRKQINEEHQKINGELREKVKVLEAKNKYLENLSDCQNNYLINSIPKQKIKDKIEELKNEKEQLRIDKNVTWDSQIYKIDLKIQVLQELLQESEDK